MRFERRQSMRAEPLTACPECEGQVQRVVQPVGVVFKGSGFYVTDHRKKGEKPASPAGKEKSDKKEPAGGESKGS
jgi:putative FmdB family regulatory protein